MRRAASRILATSLLLLGFGCASPSTLGGTGGDNGNPGAGGSTGNGGSNPGAGGSNTGNGASTGAGGTHTGGPGPACTPSDTQLVNANAYYCSTDAVGLKGSIYPYGDGMSCPYSPTSAPAKDFCAGASGCCLTGTTTMLNTGSSNWGCGIGVELDDDGTTKHVYAGSVSCFKIALTGSSGGNVVRIGFTQAPTPATNTVAPFTEIPSFTSGWTGTVCFSDVTCPGWSATTPSATAPGCNKMGTNGTPVDLQIQVSTGSTAVTTGAYNVCLSSIVPVTSSGGGGSGGGGTASCTTPSGSGTLSDQYGTAHVGCPKDYIVRNNDWGVGSVSQTISVWTGNQVQGRDSEWNRIERRTRLVPRHLHRLESQRSYDEQRLALGGFVHRCHRYSDQLELHRFRCVGQLQCGL